MADFVIPGLITPSKHEIHEYETHDSSPPSRPSGPLICGIPKNCGLWSFGRVLFNPWNRSRLGGEPDLGPRPQMASLQPMATGIPPLETRSGTTAPVTCFGAKPAPLRLPRAPHSTVRTRHLAPMRFRWMQSRSRQQPHHQQQRIHLLRRQRHLRRLQRHFVRRRRQDGDFQLPYGRQRHESGLGIGSGATMNIGGNLTGPQHPYGGACE